MLLTGPGGVQALCMQGLSQLKTGVRLNLGHACCTGNIKSYNVLGHPVLPLGLCLGKA